MGGRGPLYLLVVLSGMFCLAWVPGQLGDSAATVAAHAGLYRAGIAAFLLMQVAFPAAAVGAVSRIRGRGSSRRGGDGGACRGQRALGLFALSHRMEALPLLQGGRCPRGDRKPLTPTSQQRAGNGLRLASLFWGLWLLPFGWLVLRSVRLPRARRVLLLGGIGIRRAGLRWAGAIVADAGWLRYVRMPAAFGEIGSCLLAAAVRRRAGRCRQTAGPASVIA